MAVFAANAAAGSGAFYRKYDSKGDGGSDMNIPEAMSRGVTLSFEVFPPKSEGGMERLRGVLEGLSGWDPAYISCTCGAGGTDKGRQNEVLSAVTALGVPAVGHYTCIHRTREQIGRDVDAMLALGVDHVLALRGDYAPGENATAGSFAHATGLIRFLKERYGSRLTLGCAGFPEGHIDSDDFNADIAVLKRKQDLGCEFVITQLTFDMEQFERWLERIRRAGITMPVAAGVMPVLERDRCLRHCLSVNGCAVPRSLARLISRYYEDAEGFREAGMDYTAAQIRAYMALGVNDLHIYALNELDPVEEILGRCGLWGKGKITENTQK